MLKNEMESYVRIGGRGLKNLMYPYMGVERGVKNCQNHPYVINEWPLRCDELIIKPSLKRLYFVGPSFMSGKSSATFVSSYCLFVKHKQSLLG